MLVEFSIVPIGGDSHTSRELAEALKIVDTSGLPHKLTPCGTCIEGDWPAVMEVIRLCHERMRKTSPHVVTMINIEDEQGVSDKIIRNVTAIEEKIGRPLDNTAPPA